MKSELTYGRYFATVAICVMGLGITYYWLTAPAAQPVTSAQQVTVSQPWFASERERPKLPTVITPTGR